MRYINEILVTGKEKRGDWIKVLGQLLLVIYSTTAPRTKIFFKNAPITGSIFIV